MANMQIYHSENNATYNFTADLKYGLLSNGSGKYDYYLLISTTIPTSTGGRFTPVVINDLTDVPPVGFSPPASDFTQLMQWWLEYFMNAAELGFSSSSSSSLSSSSNSSSSSSISSLSSSSSTEVRSSSSSSGSSLSSSSSSSESISSDSSVSSAST